MACKDRMFLLSVDFTVLGLVAPAIRRVQVVHLLHAWWIVLPFVLQIKKATSWIF